MVSRDDAVEHSSENLVAFECYWHFATVASLQTFIEGMNLEMFTVLFYPNWMVKIIFKRPVSIDVINRVGKRSGEKERKNL